MQRRHIYAYILRSLLFLGAIFIIGSAKMRWETFLDEDPTYTQGDLHTLSFLNPNNEKITLLPKRTHQVSLEQADIITFGDSFFESTLDSPQFADMLATNSKYSTYHVEVDDLMRDVNFHPLLYLQAIEYTGKQAKIMLVESIERYALDIATYYDQNTYSPSPNSFIQKMKDKIFNHNSIRYFFNHNIYIAPFNEWKAKFLYNILQETNTSIGMYDKESGYMFHYEQFAFLKRDKNTKELSKIADNIAQVQKILQEQYNINMFYLIMPNKSSIYPELADIVYNDFIPHFEQLLRERGVHVISVYNLFLKAKEHEIVPNLYFKTDTHYSPYAKHMVIDEVLQAIQEQ